MGCVEGSCIGGHIVAVIESVMQLSITIERIRVSPGVGVVVAMGGACKEMGGEKWGHLRHVCHTAHVPLTDVLVEGRRAIEHAHPVTEFLVEHVRHRSDSGRVPFREVLVEEAGCPEHVLHGSHLVNYPSRDIFVEGRSAVTRRVVRIVGIIIVTECVTTCILAKEKAHVSNHTRVPFGDGSVGGGGDGTVGAIILNSRLQLGPVGGLERTSIPNMKTFVSSNKGDGGVGLGKLSLGKSEPLFGAVEDGILDG